MASKLNNKDLELVFGTIIEQGGLNDFLAFPKRKDSLSYSYPEVNGQVIDLANPVFEARQFTLKCVLKADGETEQDKNDNFWNLYNALFTELSNQGTHQLYLESIDKTFIVYYIDQTSVSKLTREENRVVIRFELVFKETDPTVNIPKVYLIDHNDRYLIA